MRNEKLKEVICDWVQFHQFADDCDYPLIRPSDVVLDDLQYRIQFAEELDIDSDQDGSKMQRVRGDAAWEWSKLAWSKGKEKRLRRQAVMDLRPLESK